MAAEMTIGQAADVAEAAERPGVSRREFVHGRIVMLLMTTQRPGMLAMVEWLEDNGFFTQPASTRFHGCYEGGLAEHSLGVYELLAEQNHKLRLGCPHESVIIAAILHDVCKAGAYIAAGTGYKWNHSHPEGHAKLSLEIIERFIELTLLEKLMVRYHMGVYGLTEFDEKKGEYNLRGEDMAHAWYHFPIVKVMYFCDELATLREKAGQQLEEGPAVC